MPDNSSFRVLYFYVVFVGLLIIHTYLPAQNLITAVASGQWGNAGTWNPSRQPANGDSIVIPNSIEVRFNINSGAGSGPQNKLDNAIVNVFGVLRFGGGEKLYLGCNSSLVINSGGKIVADNPGVKINWCNDGWVWEANDWPGYTTNGPYYLGDSVNNPFLPVELLYFKAEKKDNDIIFKWATAAETNNDYFLIQQRNSEGTFETIATIKGSGNSNIPVYYSFTDKNVESEISYYRLTQVDYDGTVDPLAIIAVTAGKIMNESPLIFQNPVFSYDVFEIIPVFPSEGIIQIFSSAGTMVFKMKIDELTGKIEVSGLKSGLYIIHYQSLDISYSSKLIVQ